MSGLNKKELDKLLKIKGETRGVVFYTDASYVLSKKGQSGLEKLENIVKELGYSLDYRNPRKTDWYPVGLRAISLILIKDTFNWSDEEIKEMGWNAPNFSFIIKIFMKFFISLKKIVKESSHLWNEHYKDIGKLSTAKFNEEKRILILRLEDFKVHPIFCSYFIGYFTKVSSFGLKNKKPRCVETKCNFRGDSYHDFKITWDE